MIDNDSEFTPADLSTGLIQTDGVPGSITFAAYDSEGRCAETCELEIHGTAADVLASMRDTITFVKKFRTNHSITATGDT